MDYGYMLSHTRYFYAIRCLNSIIFRKFSVLPENRKRGCMLRGSHGERIAPFLLLFNRITRATTYAKRERKKERELYFTFSGQKRANSRLLEFYHFPTYMDALPLPHFQSSFLYLFIFSSLSFSSPFLYIYICIFFFSHSFSRIYSLLFALIWILNKSYLSRGT